MPNFWTKAGRFISETILNNKTTDGEYTLLLNQMIKAETGINSLKSLLKNFNSYIEPFNKYIKTLNDALNQIYKDSPLKAEFEHYTYLHELILKDFDNLGKIINKLYSKTSEWNTIFVQAKEIRKVREEKRKNFDHYEQKLVKIEGDPSKKKNTELVKRNQEKYDKALKEYLEISAKSFEVTQNSIKLSWELANPIVGELLMSEKDLYEKITFHLKDLDNVTSDLESIMNKAFNSENSEEIQKKASYDPKKSIRIKKLMKRNEENFNYQHNFIRNTSCVTKGITDREALFMAIKDDFLSFSQDKKQFLLVRK
jgi:hypothetical protein